jgi:hypothetical protein
MNLDTSPAGDPNMAIKPIGGPDQSAKDFEIDQYIKALGESSSRVRLVMLAIIIAAVASLATLASERDKAWEASRLQDFGKKYSLVKNCGVGDNFFPFKSHYCSACSDTKPHFQIERMANHLNLGSGPLPPECLDKDKLCETVCWFDSKGISTEDGAKIYAEKLWEAYIFNVTYVRSPVLGFVFDINDLGLLTGLTFSILMFVMVFYTHRSHENLALSMWKVRELAKDKKDRDKPGGQANLLYHALAMQQVFTVPATLARWNEIFVFKKLHYALFALPALVQGVVFYNDFMSRSVGLDLSSKQTWISLIGQGCFLLLVVFLALICWAHLIADDKLWEDVFLYINPCHRIQAKSMWRHWVKLADNHPPAWGLAIREKEDKEGWRDIFFLDSVNSYLCAIEACAADPQNLYPANKIALLKESTCRGLYLMPDSGKINLYSTAKRKRQFETVPKRNAHLDFDDLKHGNSGGIDILDNLTNMGERLHLSKRHIKKIATPSEAELWSVGGAVSQKDGFGKESGFVAIHSLVPDGNSLFVTDGGWIREIDSAGNVTTWGGQPLGLWIRPERAFLLGMTLVDQGTIIKAQIRRKVELSLSPRLLVCDNTLRRVFAVNKPTVTEVYRSDRGWSPAGIGIDDNTIYLLEYSNDRMIGECFNYLLRTRPNSLVTRCLFFWPYLRILRFNNLSFNSPKVLYKLSSYHRHTEGYFNPQSPNTPAAPAG